MRFVFSPQGAGPQQKELVEQAATVSAQENMELACAYIQKSAIEKAVPEIDKHLLPVIFFFVINNYFYQC